MAMPRLPRVVTFLAMATALPGAAWSGPGPRATKRKVNDSTEVVRQSGRFKLVQYRRDDGRSGDLTLYQGGRLVRHESHAVSPNGNKQTSSISTFAQEPAENSQVTITSIQGKGKSIKTIQTVSGTSMTSSQLVREYRNGTTYTDQVHADRSRTITQSRNDVLLRILDLPAPPPPPPPPEPAPKKPPFGGRAPAVLDISRRSSPAARPAAEPLAASRPRR